MNSQLTSKATDLFLIFFACEKKVRTRVSVQGVESLWGDCRFIPADWGLYYMICAFCSFLKTFH